MKVEQYKAINQFHLYDNNNDLLQSYDSLVVSIHTFNEDGENIKLIKLGCDWDYSKTTLKYVYMFLEEFGNIYFYGITNKKQYVNKLIKEGIIDYDEEMI